MTLVSSVVAADLPPADAHCRNMIIIQFKKKNPHCDFDQSQSRTGQDQWSKGFQFLFHLPALCSIAALSPSLTRPLDGGL